MPEKVKHLLLEICQDKFLSLSCFPCLIFLFADLIFIQGIDVIFKVAMVLLGNHKELIKQCDSFETIVEFLKTTLPEMGIIQMERIINQASQHTQ